MKTTAAIRPLYARLVADSALFARGSINLVEAADTFAVVTMCRHQSIDLVIVEILENATNTLALCRTLRQLEHAPAILALTKISDKHTLKQARDAGVGEILVEPFVPQQIVDASAKLLGVPLREDVRILARLRIEASASHETHIILGTIIDISTSGMLVETSSQAIVGDVLSAEFYLPGDKKQVALMAKVARIGEVGEGTRHLGLKFINGQDPSTARIKTFIGARQK